MFTKLFKRTAVVVALCGAVGAAVTVGATEASASTIPAGHIQICAQGSYSAYIHVLSEPVPGTSEYTRDFSSPIQTQGECWWTAFDTSGASVQVDVVGVHQSNGQDFYIGSYWWNSSSGMGIGAEGSESAPWMEQW